MPQSERRRLLFARADEIGLDRDERIELAQWALRRDITSWSQLTEEQVCRLLDQLEGYQSISYLLSLRPKELDDAVMTQRPDVDEVADLH